MPLRADILSLKIKTKIILTSPTFALTCLLHSSLLIPPPHHCVYLYLVPPVSFSVTEIPLTRAYSHTGRQTKRRTVAKWQQQQVQKQQALLMRRPTLGWNAILCA